jgi:hypothetical protein
MNRSVGLVLVHPSDGGTKWLIFRSIHGAPGRIRTADPLVRSYTSDPLPGTPHYAGVRNFNGLNIGFLFLASVNHWRYDRAW